MKKHFNLVPIVFSSFFEVCHSFGGHSSLIRQNRWAFMTSLHAQTSKNFRRKFISNLVISSSIFKIFDVVEPVSANLVQFPCKSLDNTYHLMRSGESLLEASNILETNPLFLTNRDAALSPRGISQVMNTCDEMLKLDINPSVVVYSIAAMTSDTANIVSQKLHVAYNRMVPEYTYLDPRGIGLWNNFELKSTEAAIRSFDATEAGTSGTGARPPANDDGTPNETLYNQMIRLTQLLSVLETYYSGDTILLIFPDGVGPALLSAMIGGIPFNLVHEIAYKQGEIRYDITYERMQALLPLSLDKEQLKDDLISLRNLRERKASEEEDVKIGKNAKEKLNRSNYSPISDASNDMITRKEQPTPIRRSIHNEDVEKNTPNKVPFRSDPANVVAANENQPVMVRRQMTGNQFLNLATYCFAVTFGGLSLVSRDKREQADNYASDVVLSKDEFGQKTDKKKSYYSPTKDISAEGASKVKELVELEEKIDSGAFNVPEMGFPRRQPKPLSSSTISTMLEMEQNEKEIRARHAVEAMEEYMNRDDGADEWFNFLTELIEEDEDRISKYNVTEQVP